MTSRKIAMAWKESGNGPDYWAEVGIRTILGKGTQITVELPLVKEIDSLSLENTNVNSYGLRHFIVFYECGKQDLNLHALAGTRPST